jgi:cysteine-rich repeat protein
MKIYVDGVEVPTSLQSGSTANITSIHDSSTPVRIGTFVNINGNFVGFWDGLIDEVEFFNRSLTASEVQAIYNAGSAGKCKAPVAPPPAAAVCGNSVVEAGEQCDPAATASAQCPSTAKTCTATCQCVAQCGNGFVEGTEQCDDGNNNNGDGCSAVCNIEPPICGNGILEAGEQCDPPALASAQCPAAAKTCSPFGCACVAQCGNGFVEGTEQCDDANTNNGDGCDNTCRAEVCGNGIVQFGEGCDDGNTVAGDGCSATCQLEGVAVPECTLFQMLDLNNDTTVNILDAIIEQREIVTLPNAANGGKGCEAVVVDAA